jgi:two-component system chemotaxis response regulator CheY
MSNPAGGTPPISIEKKLKFLRLTPDTGNNVRYRGRQTGMSIKGGVMKAVVVDDSLVVRTIIENTLKPMGYSVLQAGNGLEALDHLAKYAEQVELVLLDWNMPIQDGFQTIKQIKANPYYDHICILMVSTESEDEKIGQAISAGAHGYLTKPFVPEELVEKIKKTLAAFRAR